MRTIFLADAHLRDPADKNYRLLLEFLEELIGKTETLYLLGDLFDFWIGFPAQPFRQYDAVLAVLQRLVDSGCRLVCFEGNHDFHLGPVFSQQLGAEIHTGPAVLTIHGKKIYLCHGDQLNHLDYAYRLLRLVLHNPVSRAAVRFFPVSLALSIRERLQRNSKSAYPANSVRWQYRDIICRHGEQLKNAGLDAMITGHFHLPLCETTGDGLFTILSLGDWMEHFIYGEMRDGVLSLSTYLGSSSDHL